MQKKSMQLFQKIAQYAINGSLKCVAGIFNVFQTSVYMLCKLI